MIETHSPADKKITNERIQDDRFAEVYSNSFLDIYCDHTYTVTILIQLPLLYSFHSHTVTILKQSPFL